MGLFSKGSVKNGQATGLKWNTDFWLGAGTYTGPVDAQGRPHGLGRITFKNGDTYSGEFRSGHMSGKGRITLSSDGFSGAVKFLKSYDGEWRMDLPNGTGTGTYTYDFVYTGEYKNGLRHGKGKITYGTEEVYYDGGWKEDRPNGYGKKKEKDGSLYVGGIESNMSGLPVYMFEGTLTMPNGDIYKGRWWHGEKHGDFTLTKPDGSKFNVTFEDDRLISSVQTRAAVAPKDEPVPAPSDELENALEKIVKEFGVSAFRREGNAAAVLSDILPGDKNAKLRRRINNAVESGACDCLINGGSDRELLISEAVSRLINYTDMADDTARETIEALAAVLL